MDSVVRLREVSKRFGRVAALDRVSLEVPPGVVFALLGENGAGKTTAIRILLGLTEPGSGESEVLGLKSNSDGLEIRRRVGYVPERPTLYEWMTVAEIGWFTAGFHGGSYLSRYLELAGRFDLPRNRKIRALSRGMRAKVTLSLAMAHDPELLILDEPTSGLDTLVRREFLESMVDLAAAGKTVFLSSHQIVEVERVADMVAMIHRGKLILLERLDALKAQIRELLVTLEEAGAPLPDLEGEILESRRKGRQWRVLARGMPEERLSAMEALPGVQGIEVRAPGLEEIFVAYMRREGGEKKEEVLK